MPLQEFCSIHKIVFTIHELKILTENLFSFESMVSSLSPGKEKEITATIIVSDSLFYLLINQGNANNADVNYFVDERKYFSPIDKTRFVSFNNQYLSFEIDDERNYYIIATSALGLLEFDELFDIAKDISNYSPENFNKRILD